MDLSSTQYVAPAIELLSGPWDEQLLGLVRSAQHDLCLVSPFLRREPLKLIAKTIGERPSDSGLSVSVITNLSESSLLDASLDVAALARFADQVSHSNVVHLPALHAKVYIADTSAAIVTSANLTNGGLWRNREYGVLLRDEGVVSNLRRDMRDYAALGNVVECSMLKALAGETERLHEAQVEAELSTDSAARARLRDLLADTRTLVLRARARGKTTTGILTDTILYLLQHQGPLTTQAMHPHVRGLHPDLCDDRIDRVIDGVHFGKKWKHHVRNAQQQLRRQGRIERLADGRWAMTDASSRD